MRIAFLSIWFAEKMGYSENFLPKAMAALGHEVHVITTVAQPYFNDPKYAEIYQPFIGPGTVEPGVRQLDGFTLHRGRYGTWRGRLRIRGLLGTLRRLRPDVVQAFEAFCPASFEAALYKRALGYKLFLEPHLHASVFPTAQRWYGLRHRLRWLLYAATWGRWLSAAADGCYPISSDAADVAIRYFGIQDWKVRIAPLGVDTDLFRPATSAGEREERARRRAALGFGADEVVCIYTGRFSPDKNPLCLARAVATLRARGRPVRGLFVGDGPQRPAIEAVDGCVVHAFVPARDLPPLYRAADLGVWPRQESTSQLDAAACGLPLILSDRIAVRERVEDSGAVYREDDVEALAREIETLLDGEARARLGAAGAAKMRERYSWRLLAEERLRDYRAAVAGERPFKRREATA